MKLLVVPRPVLFERITCVVQQDGLHRKFPDPLEREFPDPTEPDRSAEQQWDTFLAGLRLRGGEWAWRLSCNITMDDGTELRIDILVGRRFFSGRQAIVESLLERAHAAQPQQMPDAVNLASRLLGRPLTLHETPKALRPKHRYSVSAVYPSRYLQTLSPRLPPRSTIWCPCGRMDVPRLRGYQDSRPVELLTLHTAHGKDTLCPRVARLWALVDAREPSPLLAPAPPLPLLEDRAPWLERHLAAIPDELGGPQTSYVHHILTLLDTPDAPIKSGEDNHA